MALLPSFNNLPKYLTDAWRIDHDPYINDFYHSEEELRYWSIERLMTLFLHSSELSTVVTNGASPHLDSNGEDDDLTRRWLVESGEHSYPALREFLRLRGIEEDNMDIDGAILNGEIHIRARGLANADRKFLVCLPQLLEILRPRAVHILPEIIQYTRNPSVKAAVTVLDSWRSVRFSLHISNESFAATFARITKNILKDLDWRNVVVAGGMVLTTLLHVDSVYDDDERVQNADLDLYIYGLSPAEAENKALEIEKVWWENLPPEDRMEYLVTKNHKTITFLASYPNRRLQIVLKALPNVTAILLNFDLDICALAFDGSNVWMLPRCVRAIETGYSMFTMDLIWGSHLSDRRSTQQARVLKYADRGFGIRFLPSYEKLLEVSCTPDELPWYGDRAVENVKLEQLASAADEFVEELIEKRQRFAYNIQLAPRQMTITADDLSLTFPTGGRKGMDNFELFMRYCAAWSMDASGRVIFSRAGMDGSYDPTLYDDTPAYDWNEAFKAEALVEAVDEATSQLSTAVQCVLAEPWIQPVRHLPGLHSGRQVCGSNLTSVLRRPLVVPVLMPHFSLDTSMSDLQIQSRTQGTPPSCALRFHLQPRLRDKLVGTSERWDLKFWEIDQEAKWEGDRDWDEMTELMWSLHKWFKAVSHTHQMSESTSEWDRFSGVSEVARRYRRRFILPEVPLSHPTSMARLLEGLPTLRESLLFRAWVGRCPPDSIRNGMAEVMDTA